ncbi:HAD family hydrolase [Fontisphaera persica]|uniref:HAD family hydrolase n=1 Tax=Fontisphaera persica TaxID=2974023 RepID=UPI0024BFFC6A|nr:HAD family hydrolase [Fontisphaera persica]WCJ60543.1 HAD family hydrolase [Fontisphaera persica]
MVRLALFDIDGTLIRTHGAGVRAFARAFAVEFGLGNGTETMSFAGRTDTSLVREFLRQHGRQVTPEDMQRFFDCYVFLLDHYLRESTGGVIPGVPEFLAALQRQHPPAVLGLLTGNIRLGAEIKLRRFGLWGPFVTGAFADDHEDRNEIARVAFARGRALLGDTLQPDEVLVVGDTPHDIRCGRAIGAKTLAVATGGATLEELQKHQPDWAVPTLEGFPVETLA